MHGGNIDVQSAAAVISASKSRPTANTLLPPCKLHHAKAPIYQPLCVHLLQRLPLPGAQASNDICFEGPQGDERAWPEGAQGVRKGCSVGPPGVHGLHGGRLRQQKGALFGSGWASGPLLHLRHAADVAKCAKGRQAWLR